MSKSRTAETLKAYREVVAQQAATVEILKVIGSFPTDVQSVFDATRA
jgi:hypothetical protein